jgi:hypothetical protein
MSFRRPRLILLALFLISAERMAPAWDAPAHELIATLANARLNPQARQLVAELAQQMPSAGQPYNSTTLACWMDDLRNKDLPLPQHGLFYTWHYIDIGLDPSDPAPAFQPGNDNEYSGNVVQALKRAFIVLEGGTDPYITSRAMACAMTMHLVGDIHQPLHASTHYFETAGGWRHHDAGGNKTYVVNAPEDDPKFNLHNFWDSAWRASFDQATGRVVLDPRYQENGDPALIQALARQLAAPPAPAASLEPDFDRWALESHQIARDFVYREITATESKNACRLSSGYVARSNAIARERIVLAADRLAVLLNETLGANPPPPVPPAYPAGPPGRPYGSN